MLIIQCESVEKKSNILANVIFLNLQIIMRLAYMGLYSAAGSECEVGPSGSPKSATSKGSLKNLTPGVHTLGKFSIIC